MALILVIMSLSLLQQQRPASGTLDGPSTPLIKSETQLDQCEQSLGGHSDPQRPSGLMHLQQLNHSIASELGLYNVRTDSTGL